MFRSKNSGSGPMATSADSSSKVGAGQKSPNELPVIEQNKRPFVRPFEDHFPKSLDPSQPVTVSTTMYEPQPEPEVKPDPEPKIPETKPSKKSKKILLKSTNLVENVKVVDDSVNNANNNNNSILDKKVCWIDLAAAL